MAQLLAALANPQRAQSVERSSSTFSMRQRVVIRSERPPQTTSRGWRGVLAFWLIVGVVGMLYYSLFGGKDRLLLLLNDNGFPFTSLGEVIQGWPGLTGKRPGRYAR